MNPVLIGAKLNLKRNSLQGIEDKLNDFLKKRDELASSVEGIENEEDLETIEQEVNENEEEIKKLEDEKATLEKEIEELETQLEELNRKKPGKGEKRNMPKNVEVRDAINAYVKSKGQTREGFTSVEGGALIPEELLTPEKAPEDIVDLSKLVNVRKVNSGSGK